MYARDGLGAVQVYARDGLGAVQAEAGCDQPVSTAERDEIRSNLNRWTRDYMGQKPHGIHWHEGHPDIKRALDDILVRMIGITTRPKKLRCSAEMRLRARKWMGSLDALLSRVKLGGKTVVPETFTWGFYRGPTYTIRSWASISSGTPAASLPPKGSVVVDGKAFPTSRAAAAAQQASQQVGPATEILEGTALEGILDGIPTAYVYGGLALVAYVVMKK